MGKSLKVKECGKGICQRKDGKFSARYSAKNGARREKHFDTLPEARNWLADAQYEDKHDVYNPSSEMTVDAWFEFWIANLIADLAPNTRRNYRERYERNIQPVIGSMRLCDVKPMHCKIVLNRMEATYAGSTIRQTYIAMGTMFRAAVTNDMLTKHPMDGVRYTKPVRAVDDIKFLKVIPSYSSFIGNFLYRGLTLPDPILASIELGRRGYEFNAQYIEKSKEKSKTIV